MKKQILISIALLLGLFVSLAVFHFVNYKAKQVALEVDRQEKKFSGAFQTLSIARSAFATTTEKGRIFLSTSATTTIPFEGQNWVFTDRADMADLNVDVVASSTGSLGVFLAREFSANQQDWYPETNGTADANNINTVLGDTGLVYQYATTSIVKGATTTFNFGLNPITSPYTRLRAWTRTQNASIRIEAVLKEKVQ